QPLYVSGLNIPGQGTHNVVFVATEHNDVYAFDADSNSGANGGLLWHVNLGPSAATPNPDFGNRFGGFTEITPEVGITGTPVIDPGSGTIYLDAFTHEGADYVHRIHALNIADGTERPFSPVVVSASFPGVGVGSENGKVIFDAKQQLQRSALTLAGGMIYVNYASYAITDPYHGWVIGFKARNLKQADNYVFNTSPNGTQDEFGPHAGEGSIWMGGGGSCVDDDGNLYFATGNGYFNAYKNSGGTEYGDTLMKLSTSGGLAVDDYFTPYENQFLADNDLDLGSGGVILLPDQPGPHPHLVVSCGKEGKVYVVNRDRMTSDNNHVATDGVDRIVQIFSIVNGSFGTPSWFNGRLYYAATGRPLMSFPINKNGQFDTGASSTGTRTYNFPGATTSVSANGNKNGIVWAIKRDNPAVLVAYDATDLTAEIYSSDQAADARDQLPEGVKFAVPTVANGKVYVGTKGGLFVFGLLGSAEPGDSSAGNYTGLFYESGGVEMERSGTVALKVTKRGAFTGNIRMSTGRYPLRGKFNAAGAAADTVSRKHDSALTVNLQMDNANNRIVGSVSGDSWSADLIADHTAPRPSAFAGKYTLVFPGPDNGNPQVPQGDGYGSAAVNAKGIVTFKGALADGTKIVQSARISRDGQWPFYVTLPKKRGQVLGWLNLAGMEQGGFGGQISWIRPANPRAASYPDGFSLQLDAMGSVYQKPSKKNSMLNFSDATLSLSGG
ncbi:MAG TPA: hypothetical protein VFM25_07610, partial [Verrucomicrobiae bacterium]|nr:hypothetical protein [Verrucomicrobiae bacterium]